MLLLQSISSVQLSYLVADAAATEEHLSVRCPSQQYVKLFFINKVLRQFTTVRFWTTMTVFIACSRQLLP